MSRVSSSVVLLVLFYSCFANGGEGIKREASLLMLDSPAGENASLSRLTQGPDKNLYLSWVEKQGEEQGLYYASRIADKWQEKQLISKGKDWFVNWADFPSLSVNKNHKVAHWLQMSAKGTYDYDVKASFSKNGIWGKGITVHKDGVNAEHGFVSMLAMPNDRTFMTWLDGRYTKSKHSDGSPKGMTLRAGIYDEVGNLDSSWELDDLTCDCCQTSAAMSDSGPMVVYRDRSTEEIRDIFVTRFVDNQWTKPKVVYNDNWQVAGCPVNGPDIASKNGMTAVVWFTAKDDKPMVKLTLSYDDGLSFGEPILIAEKNTIGRVGLSILDSGLLVASWLEADAAEASIKLAVYDQKTEKLSFHTVAQTKSSRRSGFPVIESIGNEVYVTWTDIADGGSVKVAKFIP